MFDRISYISDDSCTVKMKENAEITMNLMNLHLVFEDSEKKILGEVDDMDGANLKARFLGEIVGNKLIGGTIRKPSLDAKIRVIDQSEIPLITGADVAGFMKLGVSPFYNDFPVYLDVNNFFSNHFAIFGNTGSGKSCGTTRLFQNMFHDQRLNPYKANIFIFDSSGEYYSAFSNLNSINNNYNYRYISTNEVEGLGEKLRLPVYLLNKDDLALLLQCTSHSQLPIIERMLKLALVFSQNDVDSNAYKNHLIAKAIMSILYTNETAPNKRNEIFSILASCSTPEFNLEAPVQGIGYVRKFRECFLIDNSGNFTESVLMNQYLDSFIKEEYDDFEPHTGVYYNLDTLEKALNFTLISEGWLRNEQTYGDSVTIRVRLHALIVGENAKYFDVPDYVSLEKYLSSLVVSDGKKYQIVNINLNDIDDEFAKVLTKIYSRLIFDFCKGLKDRASIPFHIILEEAHRYIQSDHDRFLFGYNIFERIAKEGRKYGVILGIITQRPVELSDNVISQCTNFLIFKINHPMDIDYIRKTIPHITDDIIEKQKALQAGTCLGFGLGFRIPLIVRMEMPDPAPLSGNCDVAKIWNGTGGGIAETPAPVQSQTVEQANQVTQTVNENPVIDNSISSGSLTPEGPNLVSNGAETTVSSNDAEPKFDTSFVITDQPIINQNTVSSMPSQAAPVSQMAPVGQEMVNQPIPELQAAQPQEPLIKLSTEGTGM
ncbi:MAG: ATP-binding protein [Bacilli bacterium]|nr:ATP-binding protein [Bacilli bacterium]